MHTWGDLLVDELLNYRGRQPHNRRKLGQRAAARFLGRYHFVYEELVEKSLGDLGLHRFDGLRLRLSSFPAPDEISERGDHGQDPGKHPGESPAQVLAGGRDLLIDLLQLLLGLFDAELQTPDLVIDLLFASSSAEIVLATFGDCLPVGLLQTHLLLILDRAIVGGKALAGYM